MRDLRAVAVHEYAHLHVARHFGIWGWVSLRQSPDTGRFTGHFNAEASDDAHAKRITGLAGACAEALAQDALATGASLLPGLELSHADAAITGAFDAAHVDECLAILRAAWPAIVRDAHGAIELETREAERARPAGR
jgi:hypothetical protein